MDAGPNRLQAQRRSGHALQVQLAERTQRVQPAPRVQRQEQWQRSQRVQYRSQQERPALWLLLR